MARAKMKPKARRSSKPGPEPSANDVGRALLGQILEAPADDARRLVYADWLEEQGNPLAELVRVHCALAKLGDEDPARKALESRAARLEVEHRNAWVAPIEPWLSAPYFERGLLRRIYGSTGKYVQKQTQNELLTQLSLLGVRETMLRGQSAKVAACRTLEWTNELWWWDCQLDDAGFGALVESPHVARLSSLTLEKCRCTNAGLGRLARSVQLPRLRRLGLPAGVHLGSFDARGVIEVLESPSVRIEDLDIKTAYSVELEQLAEAPALSRLKRLRLSSDRPGALARCRHLTSLTGLRFDTFHSIDDEHLEALLDNPAFAKLQTLELAVSRPNGKPVLARLRERFGANFTYRSTYQ